MFRGSIVKKNYLNSMLLDIGGGNTKGGCVEIRNEDINVFFPFNINLGTITLTEKINKRCNIKESTGEFQERLFDYGIELDSEIEKMYTDRPECKEKENIYLTGGAVWAFFTLSSQVLTGNFTEFSFKDIIEYDAVLKNNFKKLQALAESDTEATKVLKTYSQKHLISANTLLLKSLQGLGNLENKKIFFVKQGQISWLLAYVADSAKGSKVIY